MSIDQYKAKLASIKEKVDFASKADMEKGGAKAGGYDEMSKTLSKMSGREGDSAKDFDMTGEMQVATSKTV
jgi:hypothetical protein